MLQKAKNIYHFFQSFFAALLFGFPARKLRIIGVTGTDGKTTTVNLIYHVLKKNKFKVAMISSLGAQIGDKVIDTGFHVTTPSPFQTQKLLKKISDAGYNYLVLEVTSHALDQNRVFMVPFEVAVLTNISEEHLDYHKNFENYVSSKTKLFKMAKFSVLNADDPSFLTIKKNLNKKIITYGFDNKAKINLNNFNLGLKLPGDFNKYNALAAAATCTIFGFDKKKIISALNDFSYLKGRMEEINLGQDFRVIIDFAHTPNALAKALSTLRGQLKKGQSLIAVFGAAGERDFQKRLKMGRIASTLADFIVLTAEDPRKEDVDKIISQIVKGFDKNRTKEGENLFRIKDREKAIGFALKQLAKPNDIVAIFGKGHEKSMAFGKKEYPWSDFEAVKRILAKN